MNEPINVARYLIKLAAANDGEDADLLSQMRLHKLLYYAQGWHLALFGEPLFAARIEAWKHGPVITDLYPTFSIYGANGIPEREGGDAPQIGKETRAFLDSLWREYGRHSASALREMTHAESPWKDAWGDRPEGARCSEEITREALVAYFSKRAAEKLPRGIGGVEDVRAVYRSLEAAERSPRYSHEQVRDEVRRRLQGR